jgi:uncharacterized protein (UPF0264 family)
MAAASLTIWTLPFVDRARSHGLMPGLARSLEPPDIPAVARADVVGFRDTLCADRDRTSRLDIGVIDMVRVAGIPSKARGLRTQPANSR